MRLTRIVRQIPHPEYQYLNLIDDIICRGNEKTGRNGNTRSIFGTNMRFSLENDTIPLLTTKKLAWKTCLKELFWFMRGDTDNLLLKKRKIYSNSLA